MLQGKHIGYTVSFTSGLKQRTRDGQPYWCEELPGGEGKLVDIDEFPCATIDGRKVTPIGDHPCGIVRLKDGEEVVAREAGIKLVSSD